MVGFQPATVATSNKYTPDAIWASKSPQLCELRSIFPLQRTVFAGSPAWVPSDIIAGTGELCSDDRHSSLPAGAAQGAALLLPGWCCLCMRLVFLDVLKPLTVPLVGTTLRKRPNNPLGSHLPGSPALHRSLPEVPHMLPHISISLCCMCRLPCRKWKWSCLHLEQQAWLASPARLPMGA